MQQSKMLKEGACALADRSVALASELISKEEPLCKITRGGRKAV